MSLGSTNPNLPIPSREAVRTVRELSTALTASLPWSQWNKVTQWKKSACWIFHQMGMYWHQYLLLKETMDSFTWMRSEGDPYPAFYAYFESLSENRSAIDLAKYCYEIALTLEPQNVLTHYNLGTLEYRTRSPETALARFQEVIHLGPAPSEQPQTFLIANAHWRLAEIYLKTGYIQKAQFAFEHAIRELGNHGPDHITYAKFLRGIGRVEEAAIHFERLMSYTHRYAPEFILPSLDEPSKLPHSSDGLPVDPLKVTEIASPPDGSQIFFHGGLYFLVPLIKSREIPSPKDLRAQTARQNSLTKRFLRNQNNHITCSPLLKHLRQAV